MVVKIMRWRPWPPLISRKFEVRLGVKRLDWVREGADRDNGGLAVEIRWKGPKISPLGSFRRTVKRNCTREESVKRDGQNGDVLVVDWDEEFQSVCSFTGYKDNNVFHPWEISFTVLHGQNQGAKNKISIVGSSSLNLAEYASKSEDQITEVKIPLTAPNIAVERRPMLCLSLCLIEVQEPTEPVQSSIVPLPSPSPSRETCSAEKDEVSALKASLRKVKIFTEYVSARRAAKKACLDSEGSEGMRSAKSDDGEYAYPFDSDSLEEFDEGESDESKENLNSAVRKSFSYGTLAFANYAGVSFYSNARVNNEDEDWVYYSNRRRSDVGCSTVEDLGSSTVPDQPLVRNSKRSILPWKKRKMNFRSPKAKGEPLLKKAYGEEGGDDIDFDRRQLSSDESVSLGLQKTEDDSNANCSSVSEFGDDCFAVGTWEQKEITSRDGQMKIQMHVFFASIDQRSERAAGESACTALVAVIADWLQNNHNLMPIKSQFDSLIRDGSLEWRNLCENETYRDRFPDKHFDLETVVQAKIRDLCVVPGKSFIGFFHPEGMEEGNFEFLHGAMSFDGIWEEITSSESLVNGENPVFIVSWNDHFFVLKVETDAYYIIDTLGERLHEGCDQAYILKFDKDTTIHKVPGGNQSSEEKPVSEATDLKEADTSVKESEEESKKDEREEEVMCRGKECCKEYIKSFLAAIPIRELQTDIKKGLKMSTPLHHRLQIEFHFTQSQPPALTSQALEVIKSDPEIIEVTMHGTQEIC